MFTLRHAEILVDLAFLFALFRRQMLISFALDKFTKFFQNYIHTLRRWQLLI